MSVSRGRGEHSHISVLILSHNRPRHIVDAARSALNQTLDPSAFEVVVAKNYADAKIDGFLSNSGARHFVLLDEDGGTKFSQAIPALRGDVVVLLDDDDLFSPSKLEVVSRVFRQIPDLAFYHHGRTLIDEEGNDLTPRRFRGQPLKSSKPRLFVPDNAKRTTLRTMLQYDPLFNCSSIAFRKAVIEPFLPVFEGAFSIDHLLFAASYLSSGSLLLEETPLTRYRVHNCGKVSGDLGGPESLRSLYKQAGRMRDSYRRLVALTSDGRAPELEDLGNSMIALIGLWQSIVNPRTSRKLAIEAIGHTLSQRSLRLLSLHWRVLSATSLYALFPRLTRQAFVMSAYQITSRALTESSSVEAAVRSAS